MFLKKKDFHQKLRNEILFAVAPRTLKSDTVQQSSVMGVMKSLLFGGFLRDEGFKQLGTITELAKIIGHDLKFKLRDNSIDAFCQSGTFLKEKVLINFNLSRFFKPVANFVDPSFIAWPPCGDAERTQS